MIPNHARSFSAKLFGRFVAFAIAGAACDASPSDPLPDQPPRVREEPSEPVDGSAGGADGGSDGNEQAPRPICTTEIAPELLLPETGKAFHVTKNFGFRGDTLDAATRSPLELFEDGKALGPPHSLHEEIRSAGAGRFSHWHNGLYFSTSDGSDPRSNGRKYTVRGPCHTPLKLETSLLGTSTTHYATFQSHMQRMVSTRDGIFVTYLSDELPDGRRTFRFMRSTDEGKTFGLLLEGTYRTSAPSVEADEDGNVYLFHASDYEDRTKPALFYRFAAASNFANPTISQIPNGSAGKFSSLYDPVRQRFYLFTFWDSPHPNFFAIDKSGQVVAQTSLTLQGPYARLQYPHLQRVGSRIYVAWTSQHLTTSAPSYRSIHYMFSDDGGASWRSTNGPITIPVIGDDTGPVPQIVLPDELAPVTWLSSFLPRDRYAHFFYYAAAPVNRQHYVRIDLTNGARTLDHYPTWSAGSVQVASLDGFFVEQGAGLPIFAVAKDTKDRVVVVASDDEGETWLDYAVSDPVPAGYAIYAIGGARVPGPDGFIVGSYTEQDITGKNHSARFFRIKAQQWN